MKNQQKPIYLSNLNKSASGFTLIELLIVISIIGILTTLGAINFISVRERARDAERKSDLSQIQTAFEFYRSDNSQYPSTTEYSGYECDEQVGSPVIYLKKLPCDPSLNSKYTYIRTSPYTYTLSVCLENEEDSQGTTSCDEGGVLYTVENP